MAAKKKKQNSLKSRVLLVAFLLSAVAVLPTTTLFFFGLLPSIVSRFVDRSRQKNRTLTIGFMNFAACFPFWYKLVNGGHTFDRAVEILADPLNIIIMYGGALMGYLIDWGLSGIVASMMVQKGYKRLKDIKKTQEALVERWGPEVSGDMPLDIHGFPSAPKNEQ
ncbi:MAG TPA: hypothetical protein PKI93_00740 [Alphaproteobacteria bacterium]|nr:hypothetical protein [Alphaproteobacteria bacterium]HNS44020.1 hypothetical protein [Alphaproteobacteria bacterium]